MAANKKNVLGLTLSEGDVADIKTMKDVNGANMTVEQAMLLQQVKAAMNGSTDAARFLISLFPEESDSTEVTEAAKDGDVKEILAAQLRKVSALMDATTSARDAAALSRQLVEIVDRLEAIKQEEESKKPKDNPLNVIRFNRAEKSEKKAAAAGR